MSATRLNVRSGPGQNHTQLFVLERGDRVQVLGREGEWIRVRPPQGCRVWISADVVEEIDGGERVRVAKENANLRARAGSEGIDVVGQMHPGAVLPVASKQEGWYQVEAPEEASVWLHGRYVSHPSDGNRFAEVQALEERMSTEVARPAAEQQIEPILEAARSLRSEIRDPELRSRLDRLLSTGQERRDVLSEIETARAEIEARYQEELERIR
ncbi:MAG: SH3 domain-containing protein, partial [Planctomycetes bacterium]|nr:SH3 domain-containing protein [Planctomycetota bacterium]